MEKSLWIGDVYRYQSTKQSVAALNQVTGIPLGRRFNGCIILFWVDATGSQASVAQTMRQLRRKWKRQRQSFVLCVEKRKVNCNGPREMRTHVLEYRVCVTSWERMIKTRQKNEHYRRKFRSETPDTVNRWKAQPGRSSAMEKVRREDQRWRNFDKEKVTSEKMQVREKVGKCFSNALWLRMVER